MKVIRYSAVAAVAIFAAACGDKVTVAGPTAVTLTTTTTTTTTPVAPGKINSIAVAPAAVTLTIGQAVTLVAAVNADPGIATTVTWSSSDATKASVSTAGLVTALAATPGVAICATSTVNVGVKGCASAVVVAAAATVPATVSIVGVFAGNLTTPVVPASVSGSIFAQLTLAPGTQTISRVELLVGGVVADQQTFSAAQSAALRNAADNMDAANQSSSSVVTLTANTAAYNASTGTPTWTNGSKAVTVRLYTTSGGSTTPTATATLSSNLTLGNVDGFVVTTSGGTTAVDAAGYRWNGNGTLTVEALPVMYSGSAIGTVSGSLGANTAVGSSCGSLVALTSATALTGSVYVLTKAMTGLAAASACATTFPNMITLAATNAAGDNLALTAVANMPAGVIGTQGGIRWDNVAPPTPAFTANPNARAGGWINDAVTFNTIVSSSAPDRWLTAAVVDANFGGTVTYSVRAAAGTTNALGGAGATMTSASGLAVSSTATAYCAVAYSADVFGNTQATPSGNCAATTQSTAFGVDRTAPIAARVTTTNAKVAALSALSTSNRVDYTVTDTVSGAGNSGIATTQPVKSLAATRLNAAGTTTTFTLGSTPSTTVVDSNFTAISTAQGTVSFDVNLLTTVGYYTIAGVAQDQAGNTVTLPTMVALIDAAAPTVGSLGQTSVTLTPSSTATFTVLASDDIDLFRSYAFAAQDTTAADAAGAVRFAFPLAYGDSIWTQSVNTFNSGTLVRTNVLQSHTVPFLFKNIHWMSSSTVLALGAANSGALGVVTIGACDFLNACTTAATTAVNTGYAAQSLIAVGTTFTSFTGPTGASGVVTTSSTVTSLTLSCTLTVAVGATPAVSRIQLWRESAHGATLASTGKVLVPMAAALTTPTSMVRGAFDVYTYTWTISRTWGPALMGAKNTFCVGSDAAGNTVISPLTSVILS